VDGGEGDDGGYGIGGAKHIFHPGAVTHESETQVMGPSGTTPSGPVVPQYLVSPIIR